MAQVNTKAKRIIVCCDGTWQSSVTNISDVPSNVTRLARYLSKMGRDDKGQEWEQLVFYDAGIGTGVSEMEAVRQGSTGSGFVGKVIEAYNFIVLNFQPGDKVFCFGFSRGAYTARTVAGLVTDIGIVKPKDMQDFPELYRLYQKHDDSHMFRKTKEWREWVEGKRSFNPKQYNIPENWRDAHFEWEKRPHGEAPESSRWIEAIGVFDTVGSLGIPKIKGLIGKFADIAGHIVPVEDFGFHNVALSPYIKNAYHAMSLDEHRGPFSPTLWHFPDKGIAAIPQPKHSISQLKETWRKLQNTDGTTEKELSEAWGDLVDATMSEELKGSESHLLQVWFPGYHINIGGGSNVMKDGDGDFEQIAMITLHWMAEQMKRHLTFEDNLPKLSTTDRIHFMRPILDNLIQENKADHWLIKKISPVLKNDPIDPWQDGNKIRTRVLALEALKAWATGPIIDSFRGIMAAAGSVNRTPGQYKEAELQSGKTVILERTNEQIHPSIKYRMEQLGKDYDPIPLRGFERQLQTDVDGVSSYKWLKNNVQVTEYKIGEASLERDGLACLACPKARDFLRRLDEDYGINSQEARAVGVEL